MAGRTGLVVLGSGAAGAFLTDGLGMFGGDGGSNVARADAMSLKEIAGSVEKLAKELEPKDAGMASMQVAIIDTGMRSGFSAKTVLISVGMSISAALLVVVWRWRELARYMWVSRDSFSDSVSLVNGTMERLAVTVDSTRADLLQRVFRVEDRVLETTTQVNKKVETEVDVTKARIHVVGMSVAEVQEVVDGLENRLEDLQKKVIYAKRGILLLCSMVGSMPQQESKAKSSSVWDDLRTFFGGRAESAGIRLPKTPGICSTESVSLLGSTGASSFPPDDVVTGRPTNGTGGLPPSSRWSTKIVQAATEHKRSSRIEGLSSVLK